MARACAGHIEKPLSLFGNSLALLFSHPLSKWVGIISLVSYRRYQNLAFALVLGRQFVGWDGSLEPRQQPCPIGLRLTVKTGDDHNVKAETLCLVDRHQLNTRILAGLRIGLSEQLREAFAELVAKTLNTIGVQLLQHAEEDLCILKPGCIDTFWST